jgi:hypothetical protein
MGIIMKIYTKESFMQYATQQIINTKDAIEATGIITEVIEKFNNKVLNKRFYDACEVAFKAAGLTETYFYADGYNAKLVTRKNDCYKVSEFGVNYVDYTYYLAKVVTDDNNRINITATTLALLSNIENMKSDIKTIQNDINNIDEYMMQYDAIKKSIDDFNTNKSYITRSFLQISR